MSSDALRGIPDTRVVERTLPAVDAVQMKNRVQAAPIIAGVLTAIAAMLILTVLGLAVGSSALEPRDVGEKIGTAATTWGVISAIIAFFLGGWVAAKSAAVAGTPSGVLNGVMVGVAALVLVLWLAGSGVSGLVGALGTNVTDIINAARNSGITGSDVQQQTQQVDTQAAFNAVKDSAWWTLAGLVLPLVASAIGGWVGHNEREEVVQPGA
jgi:heme A synthase